MGEDDTTYHGAEYSVHSGYMDGHIPILDCFGAAAFDMMYDVKV